jgi:hypothetical protein
MCRTARRARAAASQRPQDTAARLTSGGRRFSPMIGLSAGQPLPATRTRLKMRSRGGRPRTHQSWLGWDARAALEKFVHLFTKTWIIRASVRRRTTL